MPVAKSFSVDDVDNRWSFEALRTPEEQCEVAQIRLPPELDVTYDGDTGVDCLGTEMRDKLEQMAPKIADAFVRKDQKRTGAFTRKQVRDRPAVPSWFTLLRSYLAHFPPVFFPFFARFHRLDEAVPTSPKPEPRAKRQWQGRPNTVG